ncbi:hypothetical protein C818_00243 [Lachnospiraceae bacterium MD308]|nr:hypothetical protein C818_00243 [Lachnospiraceae bacterium MD308]
MEDIILTNEIISKIKIDVFDLTRKLMGGDLKAVILYGSCARGDYTKDSDVDIVLLTGCGRMEVKKYDDGLDSIATKLAMKYFAVVNFVCLPQDEFLKKKEWYGYFQNIEREGEVIYPELFTAVYACIKSAVVAVTTTTQYLTLPEDSL